MKFFIDTANIEEIREANAMGILDGVTTNPSLIAKEGKPFQETILTICEIVNGPVSVEVTSLEAAGMMREAEEYAGWHKNVVVKLPTIAEGVKALKIISSEGIKTNLTLIFQPLQAPGLLPARALLHAGLGIAVARKERHALVVDEVGDQLHEIEAALLG